MTDRIDRINGLTGSIAVKAPVKVATTANITLSGEQTIDSVALTSDETPRQRVLVKDQTTGSENGIYDVNSGAWTRSPDFDGDRDAANGTQVLVAEGATPFGKLYYLSATNPVDIGTDSLTFTLVPQFGYELSDDLSPQLANFLDPNGNYIGRDKGADIASASPLVIGTDGDYFDVTGTTGFAVMTVAANRHFFLQFDGSLTMTHHATNLDLPGAANITTTIGDVAEFFSTGANTVQCVNYTRANGSPLGLLDEDDMASDSSVFPASQQSVKVYSDAGVVEAKAYADSIKEIIQVVNTQTGAGATGTTAMPIDDTIPQITEGDEYLTLAITPTSATNKLIITFSGNFAITTTNGSFGVALFQDTTANALSASTQYTSAAGGTPFNAYIQYYMTAGTTSATTFRIRAGSSAGATTTFNGLAGSRTMGGVMNSQITIMEIKA